MTLRGPTPGVGYRDGMPTKPQASTARTGRARRFDPDTELELLYDATLKVLRRNDYDDVAIADILEEAGPVDAVLLPALPVEGRAAAHAVPARRRSRDRSLARPGRQGRVAGREARGLDRRDPQLSVRPPEGRARRAARRPECPARRRLRGGGGPQRRGCCPRRCSKCSKPGRPTARSPRPSPGRTPR